MKVAGVTPTKQQGLPVHLTSFAGSEGTEHRVLIGSQDATQAGLEITSIKGGQEAQGPHAEADDRG